jgi:hypothetical protein
MSILIIIFGALTLLAGVIIIINPDYIFGLLNKHTEKLELQILAIVVRIALGVLFISQSGVSKYPLVIEIIGWFSIVSAIFFTVIGRNNFNRIISWALSLAKPVGRAGGVVAVCFGAFLIYAFV